MESIKYVGRNEKMKDNKRKNYSYAILDDINSVASVTECTGLIQIPPTNEDESESYSNIYVIPNQVNDFDRIKVKGNDDVVIEKQKVKM